jgi:hypothetical protein
MVRSLHLSLTYLAFGLGVLAIFPCTGFVKAQRPSSRPSSFPGYIRPGTSRPQQLATEAASMNIGGLGGGIGGIAGGIGGIGGGIGGIGGGIAGGIGGIGGGIGGIGGIGGFGGGQIGGIGGVGIGGQFGGKIGFSGNYGI